MNFKNQILILTLPLIFFSSSVFAKKSIEKEPFDEWHEEPTINVIMPFNGNKKVEVKMEPYVAGVIGNEMNKRWPAEALKAQAIAARSYALYRMKENREDKADYDIIASQADQVFKIAESKDPYLLKLVEETRGQVLWHDGRVLQAFYSSTCGGRTRSAVTAGLTDASPLKNTCHDSYCKESPFRHWSISNTLAEIEERFNRREYFVKDLKWIRVKKRDSAGYALWLEYKDKNGKHKIKAEDFRKVMGSMRLKSLLFTLSQEGNTVSFFGNGFGHGVGLCQFGAKYMALKKKDYKDILRHFYPGIGLKKLY